ncbi:hypothetical protein [Bradyrhizobium sp. CCBAU 53421]|uniref:hypothetical protein n=1 Tax=Bradyrhizobium sp. CCBAU 53421 TaxID=1325120 RepID=UPI00188A30E7|nr:hypothetical protein [Bradyrhizobium sp. CCBAU 53421]QOZ37879.1 hypothetical protein XH92_15175 [Bradyrhizobium sp. CCBAU 53421]
MNKRRRVKQTHSLEERLTEEANILRDQARTLPQGIDREALLKKARQNEEAAHIAAWLGSPTA